MRVVIQRVTEASVRIEGSIHGEIDLGFMILIGVEESDSEEDIQWLSNKIVNLRIFGDEDGKMNKNIKDVDGTILLISQFTLHASYKKGNRPSFINAAPPSIAIPLYEKMIIQLNNDLGKKIETGKFGTDMMVSLVNDGPVTITIDTKNKE